MQNWYSWKITYQQKVILFSNLTYILYPLIYTLVMLEQMHE